MALHQTLLYVEATVNWKNPVNQFLFGL